MEWTIYRNVSRRHGIQFHHFAGVNSKFMYCNNNNNNKFAWAVFVLYRHRAAAPKREDDFCML